MDSHVFRILAVELAHMLEGARLEKIHSPRPDTLVFTLFAEGLKRRLLLRFGRRAPLLFFSEQVPENPPAPPAQVMLLRKHCAGRRLGRAQSSYISRRIAFPLAGPCGREEVFLLLDMAGGAFVAHCLPDDFAHPPARPGRELVESLCARPWDKKETQSLPRDFPVLTPPLRETLSFLDPPEGLALVADLETGGGDLFLYADSEGRPAFYSAWPLPDAQARGRGLIPISSVINGHYVDARARERGPAHGPEGTGVVRPDDAQAWGRGSAPPGLFTAPDGEPALFIPVAAPVASLLPAYPALAGVSLVAAPLFFAELGGEERRKQDKPAAAARKKEEKLAARLRDEERRLSGMVTLGETAEAIKAVLWRFPEDAAPAGIELPDAGEGARRIALDPRFSLRENMGRMFREAARGKRGLEMLRRRLSAVRDASIEGERKTAGEQAEVKGVAGSGPPPPARRTGAQALPLRADGRELRGVARFRSSDGFFLLRGRNAAGNDLLLKSGSGHDYWLHVEDLPGAHVLVRRSHAAEEVPEATLREAAALAVEKSAAQGEATVMVALLRHVRRKAKSAPGAVEIASVLRRIVVAAGNGGFT
ncbi:MAG: NFACT RNA binding domain-containing protein [Desulfovibrio sp.]|jgi:hypothetical protein|nr:NFACT RNA binding domain-containing protein [Desulfovibrio sp.]